MKKERFYLIALAPQPKLEFADGACAAKRF
jgi:hypothetical protein